MKNSILFIFISILAISCSKDETIDNPQETDPTVIEELGCLDPASLGPQSYTVDRTSWFSEDLITMHFMLFNNPEEGDMSMFNCNLRGTKNESTYSYNCDGIDYEVDYEYESVQFVSAGGGSNELILIAGATVYNLPHYNHLTAQLEVWTYGRFSGSHDGSFVELVEQADGTIDVSYGTLVSSITINGITYTDAIVNGTDLSDSSMAVTKEHGIVAGINKKGDWYNLKTN